MKSAEWRMAWLNDCNYLFHPAEKEKRLEEIAGNRSFYTGEGGRLMLLSAEYQEPPGHMEVLKFVVLGSAGKG